MATKPPRSNSVGPRLNWRSPSVTRGLVTLMVIGAAVGYGLYLTQGSWSIVRKQRSATAQQLEELESKASEQIKQMRIEAQYSGPLGREELDRRDGWVDRARGEVPLRVPGRDDEVIPEE
ncbi:MAG: hypothetical protein SFX74_09835 [Fimbriimonadaceae bacterium]|nr:hypothetical protein [Fimbriimonadaceae bacterium]